MRRSGLTHLLSVSGLLSRCVGAAMLLTLRLLSLSERLALRSTWCSFRRVGRWRGWLYAADGDAGADDAACIARCWCLADWRLAAKRSACARRGRALLVLLFPPKRLPGHSS